MTTTQQPTAGGYTRHDLDADVLAYLQLAEQIEDLTRRQNEIKARLRALEPGKHPAAGDVAVVVSPPPRTFNTDRAWTMLTAEQRAVCVSPDAKKIRAQLAPALAEACMDEGKGEPRVTIR